RGGHDTDAQFARQVAVDLSQLLPKRIFVGQDFLRPAQDSPALGCQSAKAPTVTVDQWHGQLALELANGLGERRCCDDARCGRADIVPFARQSYKKSQMPNVHLVAAPTRALN